MADGARGRQRAQVRAAGARVLGVAAASHWSMSESPGSSGESESNWATTQPAAQMSTAGPYSRAPKSSSGARYQRVATACVSSLPSGDPAGGKSRA